jgi:hypothetical protein
MNAVSQWWIGGLRTRKAKFMSLILMGCSAEAPSKQDRSLNINVFHILCAICSTSKGKLRLIKIYSIAKS